MAQSSTIIRVMASAISVANRAGTIIRDIMAKGDLGIVEKVSSVHINRRTQNIIDQIALFRPRTTYRPKLIAWLRPA